MLFVGALAKKKSLDVLIDLFADHYAGKGQYKLFFGWGMAPEANALHEQCRCRGVEKQVHLLGKMDQMGDAI
ncbi:MAG: hypothetical protein LRY40_04810 [Shewanella fodinae]|nr:hypothetical protein [Shewanella fodinae]